MDKSFYDHYWSPDGFRPEHSLWPELEAIYTRYTTTGSEVLDLGCGDGSTSGIWMRENARNYLGADVSSVAVETARGRGLAAIEIESAESTGLEAGRFDAVICIEVLEHLFMPQLAVAEIQRLLKPGGIAVFTTPNVGYWRSRANLAALGRFDPIGDNMSVQQPWRDPHIRFFTPSTLARMIETTELRPVETGGHNGGFLNGLPWLSRKRQSRRQSAFYRILEQRWPDLFAYRTCVVAKK